jgi:hypothetical protein
VTRVEVEVEVEVEIEIEAETETAHRHVAYHWPESQPLAERTLRQVDSTQLGA